MEKQNREIEKKDTQRVIEFFKTKELEAHSIPKTEESKTPDFEIYLNDNLFAYCELKSIIKDESSVQDATYNSVQSKIHKGCKQLRTVNPKHTLPNIIMLINHEEMRGWQDLDIVLKAKFPSTKGEVDFPPYFRNRLLRKGDLANLDIAIWIDNITNKTHYRYNYNSSFKNQLKEVIIKDR